MRFRMWIIRFTRISVKRSAPSALGVPRTRIERLANEESGVTADTALRLSRLSAPLPHCGLTCRTIRYSYTARRVIGKDLDKIAPVIERST
jgi:antitoxin HigA-1